jgi:hypothetical protein
VAPTLFIVIGLVAVGVAGLSITQREQTEAAFEDNVKPSGTDCRFSGQRLGEEYYCSYQNVGSVKGDYEVERIPTTPSELAQKANLDLRQAVEKCDTLLDVGYDCTVMGDGSTLSGGGYLEGDGELTEREWQLRLDQKKAYNHSLLSYGNAVGGTGTGVQPWQRCWRHWNRRSALATHFREGAVL